MESKLNGPIMALLIWPVGVRELDQSTVLDFSLFYAF